MCAAHRFLRPPGILVHRDFRLLWAAGSASAVGDRLVVVALALFVVRWSGSATDLGWVLAARAVPLTAFLLLGGVWADRLPRRGVMVVSDLARFALHGLLAGLILSGAARIWQVVAIEVAAGSAEAFFRPAASGLLPQTVPETEIQAASALTSTSVNLAELAGPALATTLVLGVGAGWAFAIDAATFLVSAGCLSRIRQRPRGVPPAEAQAGVWGDLRAGLAEVRSRTWVWATLLAFCVVLLGALAPWSVLGALVAQERYGGVGLYGMLSAALGAGTIAGSLCALRWRPRHPLRQALLCALAWPLAALLFALGLTLWIVVPAIVLAGCGIALFDVWWVTALAQHVPPDRLSRVSSYDWVVSVGLLPTGYLLAGPLAGAYGAAHVMAAGAAIAALALAAALLPRQTRSLERTAATGGVPVAVQAA